MKRNLFIWLYMLATCAAYGLTVPAGAIHFDNARTQYAHVQFIYGRNDTALSYVHTMTFDGEKWSVTLPAQVSDIYRYTFAATQLPDGERTTTFSQLKDSISHQLNANRTATSDVPFQVDQIYVPNSSDNWAQGEWKTLEAWRGSQPGHASPSGTLPIVYINTTSGSPVVDKENYVSASCYIIDAANPILSLGDSLAPLPVDIRGRGNWTWRGFDKKPYKLRFATKQMVLGMPNSRHWALLAGADDNLGFLRNVVGAMLSEHLGLRWTPLHKPVELVLNGEYMGLYFLTETVRIEGERVDIYKQPNNNANPELLSGGWLLEIDNYSEEGQVVFYEGNGQEVHVTIQHPDTLSTLQRNYITAELAALNAAFYESTSAHWEQLVELDEIARYYLVQEIMEDTESFHGSCYFYRDQGADAKWLFGPVWDFGNSYWRHQERFIYDGPSFQQFWIGQIASFPSFQTRVKQLWHTFLSDHYAPLRTQIDAYASLIASAAAQDANRWSTSSNVQTNPDMNTSARTFLSNLTWRVEWLRSQWGNGLTTLEPTNVSDPRNRAIKIYDPNLQQLVIIRDGIRYSITGVRIED